MISSLFQWEAIPFHSILLCTWRSTGVPISWLYSQVALQGACHVVERPCTPPCLTLGPSLLQMAFAFSCKSIPSCNPLTASLQTSLTSSPISFTSSRAPSPVGQLSSFQVAKIEFRALFVYKPWCVWSLSV
jgi:hypothetical protein